MVNNGLYAEAGVTRRHSRDTKIKKALFIVGIFVCLFVLPIISIYFLLFSSVVAFITAYYYPRMNVDYEYIFVDGQIDFDKITGQRGRKTLIRIDLDQVEVAAPADSHALDAYKGKRIKEKDFTSGNKNKKPFVIIGYAKEEMVRILFEPSEKMVDYMKMKSPRKVSTI